MSLIDNEGVVSLELTVFCEFCQQDTVGHYLNRGLIRHLIVEPDLIPNKTADIRSEFFCDTARHSPRSDSPRLSVPNALFAAATQFETHLGELCCLTRSRFTGDNNHLVLSNCAHDLVFARNNRQLFWIGNVLRN